MTLDAKIWGPHYWFVLQSMALTYSLHPNAVTKKKYYDFVHNIPLFLPNPELGNEFSKMLDKYPVTPYLDSRQSFIKWVYFINNRINVQLGKDEVSQTEAMNIYYSFYKPKEIILREELKYREKLVYFGILTAFVACTVFLYKK